MFDPFPLKAWLTAAEVASMIGLSDTGLDNLRAIDPTFPLPKIWTTGGQRFDKLRVMAWAEGRPNAGEETPAPEEPPPAPRPPPRPRRTAPRPENE